MNRSDLQKIIKEELHKLTEGVGADIYVDHNYTDSVSINASGDLDYDWSTEIPVDGIEKFLKRREELSKQLKKAKKGSDEEGDILDEIDEIEGAIEEFTKAVEKQVKPLYYKLATAWERGVDNIVDKLQKRYLR